MTGKNHLSLEKSPYLLQHKDNPVHWYPWCDEAFEAARSEDKPIFLSSGYSSCYWCHVMAHDSFKHEDVADILNKYFICIKLDREERPDVDKVYMDAVVALTGRGGWPLSVFLTAAKEVFWGGTFFYKEQFKGILLQIHKAWEEERERIVNSAETLMGFLREEVEPLPKGIDWEALVKKAYSQLVDAYDSEFGGFGAAPKFPPSQQVSFLLRYYYSTKEDKALEMAVKTLEAMARGGLYDHVGGGFHRYCVDERWLVPHFEKMLYDNALLAQCYLEAFQVTKLPWLARVASQTLDYCYAEMRSQEGGYFSAQDAGDVEKEGAYYVWTREELKKLLTGPEFIALDSAFDIPEDGNFEGGTCVLSRKKKDLANDESDEDLVQRALVQLFEHRIMHREIPRKDDKILSAWNGMMISALSKGYQMLGETRYLEAAKMCAEFIQSKLWISSSETAGLLRRYRDGEAKHNGILEDYAFVIEGLLALFEASQESKWLSFALELFDFQWQEFKDDKRGGLLSTKASDLPAQSKDCVDAANPSGQSVTFCNSLRIKALFPDRNLGEEILSFYGQSLMQHPVAYCKTLQGVISKLDGLKVILLTGQESDDSFKKLIGELRAQFLPNYVVVHAKSENSWIPMVGEKSSESRAQVFVCEEGMCHAASADGEFCLPKEKR